MGGSGEGEGQDMAAVQGEAASVGEDGGSVYRMTQPFSRPRARHATDGRAARAAIHYQQYRRSRVPSQVLPVPRSRY